jgi:hypothetical protein
MSDTSNVGDGLHVVYRGQLYRRVGIKDHVRVDGSVTQLATWETTCPTCGEAFAIMTTRLRRLHEPTRRCPAHRAPGRRVMFEAG